MMILNHVMESFKMLKRLISTLFKLIGDHRNEYASDMLEYVYYWLRSPISLLYDTLLHKMIHDLMIKVFILLINEFKN